MPSSYSPLASRLFVLLSTPHFYSPMSEAHLATQTGARSRELKAALRELRMAGHAAQTRDGRWVYTKSN